MSTFARFTAVLAGALRFTADKLDRPTPPVPVPKHQAAEAGDQLELATQLCREIELRQCLRAALRRYSPTEEVARA